ncbi:MAG: DMT family transporter [Candidatus Binataceae bacterium]
MFRQTTPDAPAAKPTGVWSEFGVGLAMAVATTVIAALQPVVMRYGALKADPLFFSTVAMVAAALSAALVAGWNGEFVRIFARPYAPRLFALSLTGSLATSLLLIYGLHQIDAVAAVILLESEPVYSLILATMFLRERPSVRQLLATATILAGIGSVFGAGRAFSPFTAAALVFVTPLFWQISHVISLGVMPPLRPLCVTSARYVYAALVLVVVALIVDRGAFGELGNRDVMLAAGFTGAFVYFAGSLTWYGAISRLSLTWTTAFVIPGVPLLSFAFAIIFLGERPNLREYIGISVAILGVAALVTGADASRVSPLETVEAVHHPVA